MGWVRSKTLSQKQIEPPTIFLEGALSRDADAQIGDVVSVDVAEVEGDVAGPMATSLNPSRQSPARSRLASLHGVVEKTPAESWTSCRFGGGRHFTEPIARPRRA